MNIRRSDAMFAAACCLESAAGTIEDLVFQSSPAPKSGCNIRFVLFSSIPCLRPHYCEPHL